jgi:hypothetical protein
VLAAAPHKPDPSGSTVTQDKDETRIMYGKFVPFGEILDGNVRHTAMSHPFLTSVSKYTGEKKSQNRPPGDMPGEWDGVFQATLGISELDCRNLPAIRFLCAVTHGQRLNLLPCPVDLRLPRADVFLPLADLGFYFFDPAAHIHPPMR